MADDREMGKQGGQRDRKDQGRDYESDERSQRGSGTQREGDRDKGSHDRGVERSDWNDESEMERGGKRASEDLEDSEP